MSGRIIVLTGSGKGKTTAALGMALRAAGHKRRSVIVQFMSSGEELPLPLIPPPYVHEFSEIVQSVNTGEELSLQ